MPQIFVILFVTVFLGGFLLDLVLGDPLGLATVRPGATPTVSATESITPVSKPAGFVYKVGSPGKGREWTGNPVSASFTAKPGQVVFYSLSSSDELSVVITLGSIQKPVQSLVQVTQDNNDTLRDYHAGYILLKGSFNAEVTYTSYAGTQLAIGSSVRDAGFFAQGLPYPGFTLMHDPEHALPIAIAKTGLKVVYNSDVQGE